MATSSASLNNRAPLSNGATPSNRAPLSNGTTPSDRATLKDRVLAIGGAASRIGNRVLNIVIGILLLIALLWGAFGLWDTFRIYADTTGLSGYKPSADGTDTLSFAELCALNNDVCAWLTVDDTTIDYPVVIGEDNYEYLNKSVTGEFALAGALFLDYRNSRDFTDSYSVIFGHHLEGEAMFGPLPNFLESDYFESHTTGRLFLRDINDGEGSSATGAGTWHNVEFFACLHTDGYDSLVYSVESGTDEAKVQELVSYLQANSTQYRNIGVSAQDRIIALSTCTDATTNGRIVLFGVVEW